MLFPSLCALPEAASQLQYAFWTTLVGKVVVCTHILPNAITAGTQVWCIVSPKSAGNLRRRTDEKITRSQVIKIETDTRCFTTPPSSWILLSKKTLTMLIERKICYLQPLETGSFESVGVQNVVTVLWPVRQKIFNEFYHSNPHLAFNDSKTRPHIL